MYGLLSEGDTVEALRDARALGAGETRGTRVHFRPDDTIFLDTVYRFDTLAARMRELAYLNRGITITLSDEREEDDASSRASSSAR